MFDGHIFRTNFVPTKAKQCSFLYHKFDQFMIFDPDFHFS